MKIRDLLEGAAIFDMIIITVCSIIVYVFAGYYDILEKLLIFLHNYEQWEIDELIVVSIFLTLAFAVFIYRRLCEQVLLSEEIRSQNEEINRAMAEIRQLKEIIPICSLCRKIRDDDGFWHQVEAYISAHTNSAFSHSICPECLDRYYQEYTDLKAEERGDNRTA